MAPTNVQSLIVEPLNPVVLVARSVQAFVRGGDNTVVWETSNPTVATVSRDGVVSGVYPGLVTVTARMGARSGKVSLSVNAKRIDVTPSVVTMTKNSTLTMTAVARDADSTAITGVQIQWRSMQSGVASVHPLTGQLTAIAPGATSIYAEGAGASSELVSVTVTLVPLRDLALSTVGFSNHICGLEAGTGLAYCWGDNHAGALGVGDVDGSDYPVPVFGSRRYSSLSVAYYATCGIERLTALAYCWGDNSEGDLGNGTYAITWFPTVVGNGAIRFSSISAAGGHTCGIELSTKAGYCWGRFGTIGDGQTIGRSVPTPVAGQLQFSGISASEQHACALQDVTGIAYCWGSNSDGQIGDGTTISRLVPTKVSGDIRFSSINAGSLQSCGVERDTGYAYCWGNNVDGQIGDQTTQQRLGPTAVAGGRRFTRVDAGVMTCGLEAETSHAYCWGRNLPIPKRVEGGPIRFTAMAMGYGNALGIEAETGRLYSWWHSNLVPVLSPAPIFNP